MSWFTAVGESTKSMTKRKIKKRRKVLSNMGKPNSGWTPPFGRYTSPYGGSGSDAQIRIHHDINEQVVGMAGNTRKHGEAEWHQKLMKRVKHYRQRRS